jgi:homoserine kinase
MKELEDLEIVVPASIGNMGAGFDTLSVAVQLYLRVRVARAGGPDGTFESRFLDRPLDGEDYIERAFRHAARRHGAVPPGVAVDVRTEIPMGAGLGSSAAATVAGLRLYEAVSGRRMSAAEILAAAAELEGHPDNTSAALLGGLVGSCVLSDGSVHARSTRWPEAIRFVVLTPDLRLSTAAARRVLPDAIPRADAIFNLQRVALLFQALEAGEHGLLREALRDRWHQPYRQALVPGLEQALALTDPDLLGVCLSGAGPSIVALAQNNVDRIADLLSGSYAPLGIPYRVRVLPVHQSADLKARATYV